MHFDHGVLSHRRARATDVPDVAAAPVGDAPCCAKSIDDEARAEVPVSDWFSGAGAAGGMHGAFTEGGLGII